MLLVSLLNIYLIYKNLFIKIYFKKGLTHTRFYWMANDARVAACSLCFTERSDIDASFQNEILKKDKNPKLIGLGFHVSHLEQAFTRLRTDHKSLIWEDARYLIQSKRFF
jgi:hypothetical protein